MLAVTAVNPAASMSTSQSRAARTLAIPVSVGDTMAISGASPASASAARVDSTSPAHRTINDSASPGSAARIVANAECAASHAAPSGAGHIHAARSARPAVRRGHSSGTGGGGNDPHNALYATAS